MPVTRKKDQIWQKPNIERVRRGIAAEIQRDAPVLSTVVERASRGLKASDLDSQLEGFLLALESAKAGLLRDDLQAEAIARALRLAREGLDSQGIHPDRSRLAYLHAETSLLEMELSARQGKNWAAAWHQYLAVGEQDAGDARLALLLGRRHLRLADVSNAVRCFITAEELHTDSDQLWEARLEHVRALRLKGRAASARMLALSSKEKPPTERLQSEWDWELEKTKALKSKDLSALLLSGRTDKDVYRRAELFLMAAADPSKQWTARVPQFRTALRKLARSLPEGEPHRLFLETTLTLDRCHDSMVPIQDRVRRLGEALTDIEKVPHVEQELWIWAAATRWLMRAHQSPLTDLALSRYQGLSLRLSGGASRDVLGLFETAELTLFSPETPWDASKFKFQLMLQTLPTSQVRRLSEVAKMGMACVGSVGRQAFQAKFRAAVESEKLDGEKLIAFCEVMAGYLAKMRGPAMKLGQMMGTLGFDLPEEARRSFQSLNDQAPALHSKVIEAVLETELGRSPQEIFRSFSYSPFATGSVGQVHRATTWEGQEVAVKIQYPDIKKIIENDFHFLGLIRPIVKHVLPHWDFKGLFEEIRAQMLQECDYKSEALHQEHFRKLYQNDPHIKVARVFEGYSTGKVLTSEFIPGLSLSQFRGKATEAEKNRAAETMFRWHYECLLTHRYFNTDPHGGNYLFLKDQVAFVDFGNVKKWTSPQAEGLVDIIVSLIHGNRESFSKGMKKAEMVVDTALDLGAHYQRTADGVLRAIARNEAITLEPSLVRDDVEVNLLNNRDVYQSIAIHKENAYLFKAHWGFYATLSQLRPTSNWHAIAKQITPSRL